MVVDDVECTTVLPSNEVLGLAKSGQNHRHIIDITAAPARMKNVHTTLEDGL